MTKEINGKLYEEKEILGITVLREIDNDITWGDLSYYDYCSYISLGLEILNNNN